MPALYVLPSARHNDKKKMLYFRLYYTVKEFLYNFREALEYILPPEKEKEKFKHNKAPYSFFFKLMILFLFCSYALWYILKVTITP